MELINKKINTPAQSWTSRAETKHPPKVDYYSELRSWLHRAILDAEKNKDFNKKDQLLSLLKDLQNCPRMVFRMEATWRKE